MLDLRILVALVCCSRCAAAVVGGTALAHAAGRSALVVLTVLRILAFRCSWRALMRPAWQQRRGDVSVVYALDVSRSVAPAFVQSALNWIRSANAEQSPRRHAMSSSAERAVLLDELEQVPKLAVTASPAQAGALAQGATNIEPRRHRVARSAQRTHQARRPVERFNQPTAMSGAFCAAAVRARGGVFAFPATPRAQQDAWVEAIEVPHGVSARYRCDRSARREPDRGQAAVRLSSGSASWGSNCCNCKPA